MPLSICPCFRSFFPPVPSTKAPQHTLTHMHSHSHTHTHTPLQPSFSIQTEIQLRQTSVFKSEGHEGIYFYFSLEPLPPEHLTQFHTSSPLQSPTETKSSCLSSVIQNNLMSDYLPPFICVQFHPLNLRASIYLKQWSCLSLCRICLRCTGTLEEETCRANSGATVFSHSQRQTSK